MFFALFLFASFASSQDITFCYEDCYETIDNSYIFTGQETEDERTQILSQMIDEFLATSSSTSISIYFYDIYTQCQNFYLPIDLALLTSKGITSVEISNDALDNTMCFNKIYFSSSQDYSDLSVSITSPNYGYNEVTSKDPSTTATLSVSSFDVDTYSTVKYMTATGDELTNFSMKAKSVYFSSHELQPFSGLILTGPGESTFAFDQNLIIDMTSSNLQFTMGSKQINVSATDPNVLLNLAPTSSYSRSFTLNLAPDVVNYANYPRLSLNGFSSFTQTGSFPDYNGTNPFMIFESASIRSFSLQSSIVPIQFDISMSRTFEYSMTQNSKFLFDFDCSGSTPLSIKTESTSKLTLQFAKTFRGSISIESPYIDVIFNRFIFSTYENNDPLTIIPAFNKDTISSVTIKTLSRSSDYQAPFAQINLNSFVPEYLNDDALKQNGFIDGKIFLTVESGFEAQQQVLVGYNTNTFIHGFNNYDNCLSYYSTTTSEGYTQVGIKASLVSTVVRHVRYGGCSSSTKMCTSNETDLHDLVGSGLLPSGHNLLDIEIYSPLTSDIVLNNLGSTITALELTVEEYFLEDTSCDFVFDDDQTNVKYLKVIGTKFTKNQKIPVPEIVFDTIEFDSTSPCLLTFNEGSTLNVDSDTLYLMNSNTKFYHLIVTSDSLKVSGREATHVDVGSDSYSITYQGQTPYSLAYSRFDTLVLQSNEGEPYIITFNDDVTSSTTPKSFNLSVTQDTEVAINGKNPGIHFDPKIVINHNDAALTLTFTRPDQGDFIQLTGTGIQQILFDYKNIANYCVYNSEETECDSVIADSLKNVSYEEFENSFNSDLKNDINNLNLYIAGSSSSRKFLLNVDLMNAIKCNISSATTGSPNYVQLSQTTGVQNISISYISFDNSHISVSSGISEIRFGEVVFNNCQFDQSCSNAKLTVDDLSCQASFLPYWKSYYVQDNLYLTGSLHEVAEEREIELGLDENANDLRAEIGGNLSIIMDTNSLSIGNVKFIINRSPNYDALFYVIDSPTTPHIQINSEGNKDIDTLPKIIFDGSKLTEKSILFTFSGAWEDYFEADVINAVNFDEISLTTNDIVPFKAEVAKHFTITSTSSTSGVTGPLVITTPNARDIDGYFEASSTVTAQTTVRIYHGINFINPTSYSTGTYHIYVKSANVKLEMNSLSIDKDTTAKFALTMDSNGISSISSNSISETFNLNHQLDIFNNVPSTYDENTIQLFKQAWPLITGPYNKILNTNISYQYILGESNKPHGLINGHDIMNLTLIDSTLLSIALNVSQLPSAIPFVMSYGTSVGNPEILITNSQDLIDLSGYLPQSIKSLYITFGRGLSGSEYFSIAALQSHVSSVFISGTGPTRVTVEFPSINTVTLEFESLILSSYSTTNSNSLNTMNVGSLTFSNCDFVQDSFAIQNSNVQQINSDADSINNLINKNIISTYSNPIEVTNANYITFTTNGWKVIEVNFRDNSVEIPSTKFSNIHFSANSNLIALLVEAGTTAIHHINFDFPQSDSYSVELGSHWNEVTNTDSFSLDFGSAQLKVLVPFYPVPSFIHSQSEVNVKFGYSSLETDAQGEIDISIPRGHIYSQSQEYDLSSLTTKVVRAPDVIFKGSNLSLRFTNNIGELSITDAEVQQNTHISVDQTLVTNNLTLNPRSVMQGPIDFTTDSTITFNWVPGTVPELSISSQTRNYVPSIDIVLVQESINYSQFNDNYYRWRMDLMTGEFDCEKYLNNVHFVARNESLTYFQDGPDLIMKASCHGTGIVRLLSIYADELLPVSTPTPNPPTYGPDDDGNSGAGISAGGIAGIAIACIIVAGVIAGILVYRFTRNKYEKILESQAVLDEQERYTNTSEI